MRFELRGETLVVLPEDAQERLEVIRHFRLFNDDPEGLAKAILDPLWGHLSQSTKRPWHCVEDALEPRFSEVYRQLLQDATGYDGPLPDLELTAQFPRRLRHTFVLENVRLEDGVFRFVVFIQSQEWNGRSAAERARSMALDYLGESVGIRRHEPEFIARGNGGYKPNPAYLTRHAAEPKAAANWVWDPLFRWWLESCATAAQRELLESSLSGPCWHLERFGEEAHLPRGFYAADPDGPVQWSPGVRGRLCTWDDVKSAKGKTS